MNSQRPFRLYRSGKLSFDLQDKFRQIILAGNLLDSLPLLTDIEIHVEDSIPKGTSLAKAHRIWKAGYLGKVQTPEGLPRQSEEVTCPKNVFRLSVECIERRNPGMGSYYGFTGYYLSVLVQVDKRVIWDARGEPAT